MIDGIVTLPCMDLHFGSCPHCHKTNGCYSVGRDHWYVCHTHRTNWWVGSNLFSSWRDLSEQHMLANAYMVGGYCDVRPWWPDDLEERREREYRENHGSTDCPF
jgi:hypothetical protein